MYHDNDKTLNLFDPEFQLINTKLVIKSKLKELLMKLKKFKVHIILILDYKKIKNKKLCLCRLYCTGCNCK